jgi:hypothetical protein
MWLEIRLHKRGPQCPVRRASFPDKKWGSINMHVSSRIMVDTTMFQKMNPSYTRPSINVPSKRSGSGPASINL